MSMLCEEAKCTGCAACANVCPGHCIWIIENGQGFFAPRIDMDQCIHCGRCQATCPVLGHNMANADTGHVVAAKNRNDDERLHSSSGGIFSCIASRMLEEGACVYGAWQESALVVKHIRITLKSELPMLRGSKYIQSEIGDCYSDVRKDLRNGRKVLFSGTPCQIYGLKAFLFDEPVNGLWTLDLACHGAISRLAVKKFLEEKGFEPGRTLINWRDKKKTGWHSIHLSAETTDDTDKKEKYDTLFAKSPLGAVFANNLLLRPSCYTCEWKAEHSVADVTLGDYWGIENEHPSFDDNIGVSVVILHTNKGQALLEGIEADIKYVGSSYEKAARNNPGLRSGANTKWDQELAFAVLHSQGIQGVFRRYCYTPMWKRAVRKALRIMGFGT